MKRTLIAVLLAVLVIGTVACSTGTLGGPGQVGKQNVQGLAIDYKNNTFDALDVDQLGTGGLAVFRDGGTAVARVADGGSLTLNSTTNNSKLVIKAASTQSTPPFIVQNSSGTAVASIDNAGALTASSIVGSTSNDLNGGNLVLDPTGSTGLRAQVDDQALLTTASGTGYLQVTTGNLRVGNGVNGTAQDGEDAYIEGTLEVDGEAMFDSGADVNGQRLYIGADRGVYIDENTDDIVSMIVATGTGLWQIITGNLAVGNGTPSVAQDGEDAYVEGQFEVDGEAQFDGAMDVNGAVDLDGVVTNAANLEHILLPTWLTVPFTYTASAGGTVVLATVGAGEKWFVQDIRLNVTTNFDATGDDAVITIGDSNDVDGFCVLADAELQAADTEGTGWEAGYQCQVAATRGVYIDGTGGFIYDGAETIDAIISASGNDLSAGAATAYLLYTRLQ